MTVAARRGTKTLTTFALCACNSHHGSSPDARSVDARPKDSRPVDTRPVDAPLTLNGLVMIYKVISPTADSGAEAVFAEGPPLGTVAGTDGPCTAYSDTPEAGYSAGAITVTGTAMPMMLTPTNTPPFVRYTLSTTPPLDLFAPGASISVQAAGDHVPQFSTTLVAPAPLMGFTPPATISRSTGYTVHWTAGAGPGMWVGLIGAPSSTIVICRVPDTGSFTIPPSTLALIPTMQGELVVGRVAEHDVAAGAGTIDVVVMTHVPAEISFTM
jgi:hypothetical protein